jgi:hypothetical protein
MSARHCSTTHDGPSSYAPNSRTDRASMRPLRPHLTICRRLFAYVLLRRYEAIPCLLLALRL